jgi:hypothetical protein
VSRAKLVGLAVTLVVVGALYANGNFDPWLANGFVPLNAHECVVHPLTGETLCGRKAVAMRRMEKKLRSKLKDWQTEADDLKSQFEAPSAPVDPGVYGAEGCLEHCGE